MSTDYCIGPACTRVDKRLGSRVERLRAERGVTCEGLARHIQLDAALLQLVERGEIRLQPDKLLNIAEFFNVKLSFFFEDQ